MFGSQHINPAEFYNCPFTLTGGVTVPASPGIFRIGRTNGSVYTDALMQPYPNHTFSLNITAQDASARMDSTTLRVYLQHLSFY